MTQPKMHMVRVDHLGYKRLSYLKVVWNISTIAGVIQRLAIESGVAFPEDVVKEDTDASSMGDN
jgi:hypothetical protein